MVRQHKGWLWAPVLVAAWLESCGAMTIEPVMPDEPVAAPPPAPRLVRRDGGGDAAERGADDRP